MWYYEIDGVQNGPVDEARLVDMINSGAVGPKSRVWQDGMPDWVEADTTEFGTYFSTKSQTGRSLPPSLQTSKRKADKKKTWKKAVGLSLLGLLAFTVLSVPLFLKVYRKAEGKHQFLEACRLEESGNVPVAISLFEQAAKNGYLWANGRIAYYHFVGMPPDGARDVKKAYEMSIEPARNGCPVSNFVQGAIYDGGSDAIPLAPDHLKALHFYKASADKGFSKAFTELGKMYNAGCGVSVNKEKAAYYYQEALNRGEKEPLLLLGTLYYLEFDDAFLNDAVDSKARSDLEKGVAYLTQAAEAGFRDSLILLGICYRDGHRGAPDYAMALTCFKEAAKSGNSPIAEVELGRMYNKGLGVTKDPDKAFLYFQKANESGIPIAKFEYGMAYLYGVGVKPDILKGAASIKEAADQNFGPALLAVGILYEALGDQKKAEEFKERSGI